MMAAAAQLRHPFRFLAVFAAVLAEFTTGRDRTRTAGMGTRLLLSHSGLLKQNLPVL
jgi:hypothetical protein